MRIRAKLALSFLAFTVIPLAGLTWYSYYSSIRAFRDVVQDESISLAKEMGHRMEVATKDIQRRIDRLDRKPFYDLWAGSRTPQPEVRPAEVYGRILTDMGEMAAYVDSLEIPTVAVDLSGRAPAPPAGPANTGAPRPGVEHDAGAVVVRMDNLNLPSGSPDLSSLAAWIEREKDRVVLNCDAASLNAKAVKIDAQKVHEAQQMAETSGIGARAVEDAMRRIEERAPRGAPPLPRSPTRMRSTSPRHANMELLAGPDRPGDSAAPAPIKAQIRAHELVRRIFESGRRIHGEINFAIDQAGSVHVADEKQMTQLRQLGLESNKSIEQAIKGCPEDWIVASVKEPALGMTFGVARPVGASLRELRLNALRNLGVGSGLIILALLGIIPLSSRMTRRVSTLSQGVEKLSKGDLTTRVPVESKDELGCLAAAFNQMASDLGDHQKRLVEQERLQKELEMCRRIQEVLLPQTPLHAGFVEVKGVSIPARQVGGDFFNYFVLPEGEVAVLMGDVSGKGVPAALLMANLQARLQTKLQVERNLAKLADELDQEVSRQTESATFATLFMGIVARDGRSMRWVNAGHNPQFVLSAGGELRSLDSTGKPIGLLPGDGFEERQVELRQGDFLFLYTDGLTEAANPQGDEFGTERLEQVLVQEREASLDEIVGAVVEAVRKHRTGAEAGDDATLLALKIA
jgi:serine phosphatase RsbU (regulator of sigma subunit)/ferredoxin